MAKTESDIKRRDDLPEDFSMTVGKKHFEERKSAGAALNAALQSHEGGSPVKIGKYGDFDIYAQDNRSGYIRESRSWEF